MNIKQVSQQLNISTDTLRYWERVGVVPPVHRNASGYRDYTDEDIDWCNFAQCMRNAGVSIECLIEYIELYFEGPQTAQARKELLQDQLTTIAARMHEIQDTYDRLKVKIEHYDTGDGLNPFKHQAE
jgi:DNA-binding transcriptional MerR regulator